VTAKLASITILLLLPALTEAQQVAKCPQPGPLSEAQVTELVKGSIPRRASDNSLPVAASTSNRPMMRSGRLRSAGALESVLAAVRAASGPNARKRKAESVLWESIKDSQDASVFEDYLRRYSEGQYATPARQKYRDLKVAGYARGNGAGPCRWQWDAGDERIRDLLPCGVGRR